MNGWAAAALSLTAIQPRDSPPASSLLISLAETDENFRPKSHPVLWTYFTSFWFHSQFQHFQTLSLQPIIEIRATCASKCRNKRPPLSPSQLVRGNERFGPTPWQPAPGISLQKRKVTEGPAWLAAGAQRRWNQGGDVLPA